MFWLQLTTPYHGEPRGSGSTYANAINRHVAVDGTELSSKTYVSTLINGRGRQKEDDLFPLSEFKVKQGQTYRFRMIHSGAEFAYEVKVDNHSLTIVSSDGFDMKSVTVDSLIIFPGERFDFDIHLNNVVGTYLMRVDILRYDSENNMNVGGLTFGGKSLLVYDTADKMITEQKRECTQNNRCTVFNCPFRGYPGHLYTDCVSFNEAKSDDVETKEEFGTMDSEYEEVFLNVGFSYGSSVNARKFVEATAPLTGAGFFCY